MSTILLRRKRVLLSLVRVREAASPAFINRKTFSRPRFTAVAHNSQMSMCVPATIGWCLGTKGSGGKDYPRSCVASEGLQNKRWGKIVLN